ncbi:uracil-DNA glycosylase [bacterium]|nr:uracil-DNA glycosylase [bacterium]
MSKKVQIEDSWYGLLKDEFEKDYFTQLTQFIKNRKSEAAVIYPPGPEIFSAFNTCLFDQLTVVILGQDPYHGPGEAHGMCFSVRKGIRIPPSLRNIYKELNSDLNCEIPSHGELVSWAENGVLLLNAILTVEHKSPASHKDKGWEIFTDRVIELVSEQKESCVFILWGAFAKSKKKLINTDKHLVIEAPHPAAEVYAGGKAGFFGSKPFSKTNEYLSSKGIEEVAWCLE